MRALDRINPARHLRRALLLLLALGVAPLKPSQAAGESGSLQRILNLREARSLVSQAQREPRVDGDALVLEVGSRGQKGHADGLTWAPTDARLQARWLRGGRGVRLRGAGVEIGVEREGAEAAILQGGLVRQEGPRGGSIWFDHGLEMEELVELPPGISEQRYHVEVPYGYRLKQAAPWLVEVQDSRGIARLRMATREAWASQKLPAPRLEVEGGEVRVRVEAGAGGGVLDPSWAAAGTLVLNRPHSRSILLPDGHLLLVGGDVLGSGVCETFDPETHLFTASGSLGAPRDRPFLHQRPDGKIVVFGGQSPGGSEWVSQVELYDAQTREFSASGELDRPGATFAPLLDGTVLLVGGEGDMQTSLERWDPTTGARSKVGTLLQGRTNAGAIALPGGEVLIVGGGEALFAERYDPASGQSVAVGELHANVKTPFLELLASGDVLVGGGDYLVERWSRKTGAFHVTGSAPLLGFHRLNSGQIFRPGPLGSTALFEPDGDRWFLLPGFDELPENIRFTMLPTGHLLGTSGASTQAVGSAFLVHQEPGPDRGNEQESLFLDASVAVSLEEGKVLLAQDGLGATAILSPSLDASDGIELIEPLERLLGGVGVRLPSGRVIRIGGYDQETASSVERSSIFDPALRRWIPGPSFANGLQGHRALLLDDGRLLVAGGESFSTAERQLALWNEKTNLLSIQPSGLQSSRNLATLTKLSDGRVLVYGGSYLDAPAEIFDPKTDKSVEVGALLPPRFQHTATALADGSVLVVGGKTQPSGFPELATEPPALRFNPVTLAITPLSVDFSRFDHSATLLPDGRVLLVGGLIFDPSGFPKENAPAQIFDPATNSFSIPQEQPILPHTGHQLTPLPDGRWLLFGGSLFTPTPLAGLSLEIFDPKTGIFTAPFAGPSKLPGRAAAAVLPSGRLLLAGGGPAGGSLGNLFEFEPSSGELTLLPGILQPPRASASALLQDDGSVLLAGGEVAGVGATQITRYDPATHQLTERGPLSEGVISPALARLPRGKLLIAGAASGTLERHDPLLGSTVAVGKATPRTEVTAAALSSGDVLLAGGVQGTQPALPLEQVAPTTFEVKPRSTHPLGSWAQVLPGPGDGALVVGENFVGALAAGGGLQFIGGLGENSTAVILPSGDRMVFDSYFQLRCELFSPTGSPLGECRKFPVFSMQKGPALHSHVLPDDRVLLVGDTQINGTRYAVRELLPRGVSRPLLQSWPADLIPGTVVTLQGARFHRMGAVGAGYTDVIPGLHPSVFFQVDGGGPRFARVLDSSDTSVTFEVPRSPFPGPGWLYVVSDGVPSKGVFARLHPADQGSACQSPAECGSGFCVDGVCCESACEGACFTCLAAQQGEDAQEGACRPVAAGLDPDNVCEADNLECGKTGVCDGTGQCQLAPTGTPCFGGGTCEQGACLAPLPASCDPDGKTLVQPDGARLDCSPYSCQDQACRKDCEEDAHCIDGWWCSSEKDCRTCEGEAVRIGSVTLPCAPYICEQGACRADCENDQDCSGGYRCTSGQCGPYCSEDGASLRSPDGDTSCEPYRCLQGACASFCVTNLECAPGLLCGADGSCRAPAEPEGASAGCSHAGRGGSIGGWWIAALLLIARRRRCAAVLAALLGWRTSASAADPPADALAAAKDEFRKGVVLFEAGDIEVALEHFRRSRALFPSLKNTMNMAVSLDRLGRHDEALELFEEVLTRFNSELSTEERQQVPALMAAMRSKVGELELSSSANGEVHVDGRRRAELPLSTPLRLLAGRRKIRVLKEGHEPYEADVEIRQGERSRMDVVLRVLTSAGRLRVEQAELVGADVMVDGARVGELPWEGTLAAGSHVVQVLRGPVGSAPSLVTVIQGQTTLLRLRVGPLAPLSLRASLPSARLFLGDVPLGQGSWGGALPEGTHTFSASEDGYFTKNLSVELPQPIVSPAELVLTKDPTHPRWPRPASLRPWIGLDLGGVLGASLGSSAEVSCGAGCSRSLPVGGVSLLTFGVELPLGISLDLRGGYLGVGSSVARRWRRPLSTSAGDWRVDYELNQEPFVRGPLLALGASRGISLGERWALRGALAFGFLFATSSDAPSGNAASGSSRSSLVIPGSSEQLASSPFLALMGLGIERHVGSLRIQGALQALFVAGAGGAYHRGSVQVPPNCSPTAPTAVGCAPEALLLQGQRGHGPFALLLPTIGLRYSFGGSSP